MAQKVKLEGFRELDKALAALGKKSTEASVLRRVAKRALEPVLEAAKTYVPVDEGKLRDSIVMGSALNKSARKQDRKEPRKGVRVFVGTASRNATPREFGSVRSPAQPFMRPAWDYNQEKALQIVKRDLGTQIEKTAARVAKKRAKSK